MVAAVAQTLLLSKVLASGCRLVSVLLLGPLVQRSLLCCDLYSVGRERSDVVGA